jgi:hypothetical protein
MFTLFFAGRGDAARSGFGRFSVRKPVSSAAEIL